MKKYTDALLKKKISALTVGDRYSDGFKVMEGLLVYGFRVRSIANSGTICRTERTIW
jgi:hypothetical protein